MKLVFPNGERGQLPLDEGVYAVGAGAGNEVRVEGNGVAEAHARIEVRAGKAYLHHVDSEAITTVNGKGVKDDPVYLEDGDLVYFGQVYARIMTDSDADALPAGAPNQSDDEELGATKVRAAMPNFVIRGVSGSTFGKSFPLYGTTVVGRHADCDITLGAGEVSRRHARLQVIGDQVEIEDLGSANGTFINGERVTSGKAGNGDELRFDQVRFLLQQPGVANEESPVVSAPSGSNSTLWIVGAVVAAAAIAAALWFAGVF